MWGNREYLPLVYKEIGRSFLPIHIFGMCHEENLFWRTQFSGNGAIVVKSVIPDVEEDVVDFSIFSRQPQQLIPILQHCQSERGYISWATVTQIADYLGVSEAHVYGVASFYTQFRFEKPGDHQVRICLGTACHVQGGKLLSEEIQKVIGIEPGEISQDGEFEFHEVACLGCCAQAPVVEIDNRIHGKVTRKKLNKVLGRQ